MFCDRCGAPIQPGQLFCGACGKSLAPPGAAPYLTMGRVQEHLRFVSVLWLVVSVLNAVAAVVLWILSRAFFPHLHELGAPPEAPTQFLTALFGMLAFILFAKAVAGFFAGWGLMQREPWARTLTIVLSFLALLNIPFGTALGIYSLWVLLPASSEVEYRQLTQSASPA